VMTGTVMTGTVMTGTVMMTTRESPSVSGANRGRKPKESIG